ncbi:MAG: hypothetical protein QOG09_1864 [Solirubrobacterales bacterium]|jgi:hypothetical protein|nr:hypothetical protein [Solirubrobacterales bacterium]MDX6652410.1 hypothetical protein [Solirubrobacterales bacterium]MDX6663762.1 hypothetical protein [Solirubrobacterales bacterium]
MERTTWTDERLDDFRGDVGGRFDQVDARFDRVDTRFDRVEADIRDTRIELRGEIAGLRTELTGQIEALRITLIRVGGGILAGLVGVIVATILARG